MINPLNAGALSIDVGVAMAREVYPLVPITEELITQVALWLTVATEPTRAHQSLPDRAHMADKLLLRTSGDRRFSTLPEVFLAFKMGRAAIGLGKPITS